MTPGARLQLTRAALQAKAARGERTSRRPPWGWRVGPDGVHLEPAPAELATLARARELHAALSFRQVTQALAAEGHRNREGRPLGLAAVHRMLTRGDHCAPAIDEEVALPLGAEGRETQRREIVAMLGAVGGLRVAVRSGRRPSPHGRRSRR